jgi:transcriptional regulator with XRE-family HTH domain
MNVLSHNLAKLIKQKRKELKITQPELSARLGYTSKTGQTVSNVERGTCQLPIKHINQLSLILRVSREAIILEMVADYKQALILEISK